jgi:hypothetical protein
VVPAARRISVAAGAIDDLSEWLARGEACEIVDEEPGDDVVAGGMQAADLDLDRP